jgi:hypothetical protein
MMKSYGLAYQLGIASIPNTQGAGQAHIRHVYTGECGWRYQAKISKRWLALFNHPLVSSFGGYLIARLP